MNGIVLDNAFETKVLTDYMAAKGLTNEDLFTRCVANLDAGRYALTDEALRSMMRGNAAAAAAATSSFSAHRPLFPGQLPSASRLKGTSVS